MFNVIWDNNQFKTTLISHMLNHHYEVPNNDEAINHLRYDCEGELIFPCLTNFTDTYSQRGRIVYVKPCRRSVAKAIVYTKTNKLPRQDPGGWRMFSTIDEYNTWLEELRSDMYEEYGIRSNSCTFPPAGVLKECIENSGPFLAARAIFYTNDGLSDMAMKMFILTKKKAKELLYYNKPVSALRNKSKHTTIGYGAGYIVSSRAAATQEAPQQELRIADNASLFGTIGASRRLLDEAVAEVTEEDVAEEIPNPNCSGNITGIVDGDQPQCVYGTANNSVSTVGIDMAEAEHTVAQAVDDESNVHDEQISDEIEELIEEVEEAIEEVVSVNGQNRGPISGSWWNEYSGSFNIQPPEETTEDEEDSEDEILF